MQACETVSPEAAHDFAAIQPDSGSLSRKVSGIGMASDEKRKVRLVLAIEAGEGAVDRLTAVLAAVPVASVIIAPVGERPLVQSEVAALVEAGQSQGTAMLVAEDVEMARAVRADGVHIGYSEDVKAACETARAVLGGRAIVGGDAGRSKHEAMTLGEIGADYVAFGVPAFVKDRDTAFERQRDLVEWWAEIFEIQCVAMDVASLEHAAALAAAGADFICLRLEATLPAGEAVGRARAWTDAIAASA